MPAAEYFIDTNIFLRVIVKDDKKKAAECERAVELIRSGTIRATTAHLVLAELVWTCLSFYQIGKVDVIKLAHGLAGIPHMSIYDDFDVLYALSRYERHNVKFIDALIASHAKIARDGVAVLSYDADFDKMGITRVEPAQILL